MIHPKQKRVVAYCVETNRDYRLDLSHYGARPSWPMEIVLTVAKREMKRVWHKPVSFCVIEDVEVPA